MTDIRILVGDVLDRLGDLPDASVHCVVTSPPYWGLRDYGVDGQLGLEPTIEEFIEKMTAVFEEVRRVLRDDGTLWLNMGDCYNSNSTGGKPQTGFPDNRARAHDTTCRSVQCPGLKPKDLVGQPWRLAFALQAAGWYLRSDIIWHKPNPMPESCRDRPTKSHEYVFLMTKKPRYFFDQEAVKEGCSDNTHSRGPAYHKMEKTAKPGKGIRSNESFEAATWGPVSARNIRSVWKIATQPFGKAHFATFPEELPYRCISAGTSEKGCCPDCGAPIVRVVEKTGGTPDPARGWDTAPVAHGREKRRKGSTRSDVTPTTKKGRARADGTAPYRPNSQETGGVAAAATTKTIGWQPSCECGSAPVPCTVLDPFGGAGTTGLVAARMGRNAILVELNPEYAEMAAERIKGECALLANVTASLAEEVKHG